MKIAFSNPLSKQLPVHLHLRSVAVLSVGVLLLVSLGSFGQLPTQLKAEDRALRDSMIVMTRQLGTICLNCHNNSDFTSSEKLNYKIAKEHIRLTQILIDNGMNGLNGQPKADCYMCHRGQLKPSYREPFDPITMKKEIHTGLEKKEKAEK